MKQLKLYLVVIVLGLAFWLLPSVPVHAATIFLAPASGQLSLGQTLDLELTVNSADQGFNAAQATVQFPAGVLQVKSIDSSPSASAFNFWLTGPIFSNTAGTVTLLGGTNTGIVGASIGILKITFVAKAVGTANITISDAAVTAADGSGTNILNTVAGAGLLVAPAIVTPNISTSTVGNPLPNASAVDTATSSKLITPKPILRPAVPATATPALPQISVPFYPDQTKWYNQISNFFSPLAIDR